ncbi:titin-like isoform X22 [Scylla paramamosain]|uniref:titin-like isoform X22 n=1 Tax=Scylla paramamosain TaxID=85552 RepID=UPI0030839346
MDKAKEWLTTLTAHLPEWCAEWIPDVDQWQWQQWHPADLWQWARTREWRVPELPRWGEDGTLVPEWIFPSYWRKRVREAVLWVWLIFITFLAAREEQTQREVEGSQLENDSGAAAHADDQRQKVPSVPEEGEEEEDDEETGAWRGGLERPGGLTRYPGIENLLAQPPTATPPPPRHRPPPPVTATQVSNKQILLKPDETQSRKNESREGGSEEPGEKNHQDEVWKTLLAKYGTEECVRETDKAAEEDDEEEVPEYVGTAEEIVERYSAKFEEPRQDMSPEEEFSAKVGRRLEEYLQRLDEDDEESSQAKEVEQKTKEVEQTEKEVEETGDAAETEEARDIEDGGERLEGITSNGNENRIFIVIEDEESEDDRRNLNDISEGSEISQALETQDAELKDEGQLEEEIKEPSSQQNGLSCEAEPQEEAVMETVPEASGKVDDREEIVEHAADTVQPETPHDAAEGMKAELKDDTINMTEEQPSDATLEEKGKETKEEYTKEVVEKTPETATTYVAEDQTEESIKLSSGEEVKLEEDAEITSIEPPKEQDEMAEQESTKQTSPQPPEEVKQEEVQTLAAAEEGSERHDNVSEDVIMKEQDSIESEALATRHETQEETTEEDKVVEEEEEEKYKQIKEDETIKDEGKETLEIKVATDVSAEENKVVEEQETANKDAREDEKVLETEVFVKLPEDVKKEAVEEEKKHQVEAGVTEDEERELPTDKAAEVAATEPPAAVEEIQVDEETHFEDGKAEESKDEAMVVEEHMEDEEVPVASVEGWTQDVWGTLGQAPGEAAPLAPPASIDMMEEDTEDVMEVDVEEEVGETMEEDLEVFVDDVDLRELPESPVPLPTVPEEEDHLAEVQDLLVRPPPRKHRRRHRQEEEHADTKGMSEAAAVADPSLAKYMTMPPALSPEEEEELRKYLAESGDAKDLSVDKFMSMPTELTEQEQKELEEAVRERERVRQAESAGLDRFLNMPVGLTEQEIHELKDLEREKEEAAVQPWERGDVGFEDYLSMPHTLTEEEERMLQEGEEDEEERQFASEEEYREYVKNKFLSQLEEDALRMAEEDYDYDEDYDDDYEYEDDEEYEDEEEVEDEDEGEMEGEYVMVSDLAAASNLPQAAAASTAAVPAATAPAAATAAPAKMVDEAVNTELNDPKEDAKSKKKPFPFPKKSDRETTPEDSNSAAQKKFFHFGSLGTKRKKETPDFLDKKYLGNPNGRKFDGGGGGGSLSAAFCTVGDQVTRAVLQKVKGQIRQGKATKEVGLRKDFAGVSESGGVGSPKTSRGFTRLYLKPDQSDSGAGDEETPLSNPAEHLNSKNELEHVFAKIIKSYKSPNDQTTQGSKPNHSDNVTKSEMNEAKRTLDAIEQTQEEDATRVFIKDAEKDLMSSPILDIIMEEEEEEMDAEVALVFTHEREVAKAGGDEEDFWLRWSNEERACVSAARDCCSPWQLAEGADTDREDNEEAVRWSEEKEGSSQTGVKVTVNNEENDKTNRNEEEKDEEVMGRKYKQETIREKKAEETQRGSAMANVETTDAAKGAKGLRFKKRTTTTTRTENGIGGIEKKKEVVEQVEKKKQIEESGGKKIEVTTEKKKVEVREERKKADIKEEKKKEVEEEKKKEAIEEEDKENGVAEDGGEKKKKKKKHRDSEDGERLRKKKKKKRDSEKENKKAAYQKRDDILEKHVGPRVRSFDAAKMKSKFEKPKQVSQVSSECRQCGKQVFQMEKIVAEKAAWHKNCFRCKECNCILTLETYQSHEGVLYCKPHFKELFRPKVVVEDPDEARKERLLRRPKLIVLESQPQELAEGVVRSTNKPDYGLEDLSHANLKQKFKMFEQISTEEERVPDPIPVRRSQSLLTKAARFMQSDDDYGIENSELGEYDEDEEDEDYEEDEEEDGEEGEEGEDGKLNKKSRAASFSGMKDLKAGFARKNRQDELTKKRRQELAKFRQMLCAGKNISTREIFEGGNEDEKGQLRRKEQIKIEGQIDAKNLRERFEKGLSVVESDSEESGDRREVDRVFKEAETASKARNLFKQIDKTVAEGGEVVLRPASSAQARRENRLSRDGKRIRNFTSQIFEDEDESNEEEGERSSLADRFKFFATYEERAKEDAKRRKKLFLCSSDPDGEDQVDEDLDKTHLPKRCMAFNCAVCRLRGIDMEELELGRDPNLVKCTDNYEDEVDCRGTRKLLAKFKKMEKQAEIIDKGPRPPKQFTPPPEGEEDYDSDEEYSDEEYSDEEEEDSEEEDSEEEDSEEEDGKPKYKDEVLEMVKSSQSAKKAASLRAKFEKWESEVERNNEYNQSIERYEDEDECMPSIDTARNLRAMFENKAQESTQPVGQRPKVKVNRFVGGGGDKCMLCDHTVYAMERLEVAGRVLHKNCFKCCKCSTKLSMNTFSIGGDDMYCTTHYKQAFTEKGTYDVFTPNKGKWTRKIEATNSESSKSQE